jgi:hypothetical protein
LPVPQDPARSIADWVTTWTKLYNAPVTAALVTASFSDWDALRSRTPLNERDSVFGLAHRTRARVSDAGGGDPLLRPAWRRPTEARIDEFVTSLKFGIPVPGGDPYELGETWGKTEKDRGLVCFVCLSDVGAGEARPGYFTASTGFEKLANLVNAANGKDIKTAPLSDPAAPYSPELFAARVAHECGHALGLGDEYGPGDAAHFTMGSSAIPLYPNLQVKTSPLVSGTTPAVYDPDQIKWLWPRAIKVGLVASAPEHLGGTDFKIRLLPNHGKPFAKDDLVLIRWAPLNKADPYAALRFAVDRAFADSVDVIQRAGQPLDPNLYDASRTHVFICASLTPGVELKLVADPVLAHIRSSGGPLNAPPASPGAACVASRNAVSIMTPTNVPKLKFKKPPPAMADVIGLYEGGGHYDCGVFRPAGRCKMRTSDDKVIPFCQVCRFIMVDRVDPMKLADLDKLYAPHYPI